MLNKKIHRSTRRMLQFFATPVLEELPFFILFLFAISVQPLRFLISSLTHSNIEVVRSILLENIPRAAAIAYIFTLLVYYCHSKIIKVVGYVFASILFTVCLFLMVVFGKTLQPDIILLIVETNNRESQEFLSTFLLSRGGYLIEPCCLPINNLLF